MAALRASRPRFKREGAVPRVELTEDDAAILETVYRHRFVRADDLYRLFPDRSPDRLSRRLTLLFRAELLDRPIAQLDKFREGGSKPLVYGLGNTGARYLKETLGTPIGATDWRSRNRTYTRENLDHTLAVSRFLIDLEIECRGRSDLSLISFDDILAASPETTRKSRFPMSWSVPIQWHGGKADVQIAPDAIFGLRAVRLDGTVARAHFFLEMDRGTMTIVPSERVRESDAFPFRATILRKLYAYSDSFVAKRHEVQFGIMSPRVLFIANSEKRARAIASACKQELGERTGSAARLFLFMSMQGADCDRQSFQVFDVEGSVRSLLPAASKGSR